MTTTKTLCKTQDKGWATLSSAGGLVILILVVIWAATKWDEYWQSRDWQVSAVTVSRFTQAVRAYTGRYYETLLNSATTTTPVIVTPAMLKNTGFLEPGFNETISSGQKLTASLVRHSTNSDQLQGLIISQGGLELPYMAVRDISVSVSSGLGAYLWGSDAIITGANASWTMPLATFGVTTTTGHIATLLTADELSAARQDTDRLYRFSVTGKPDLNRMHTNIDMGENDLNNTGTVNAKTGQFSGEVTAAEGLLTQGNTGWTNETYKGGVYMDSAGVIKTTADTGIHSTGRLTTDEYLELQKISVAGTTCPKNGLVSADSTGAILSCQDLIWTQSGKISITSGVVASGKYIPIPAGFTAAQCTFMVTPQAYYFYDGGRNEPSPLWHFTYSYTLTGNYYSNNGGAGNYTAICQ